MGTPLRNTGSSRLCVQFLVVNQFLALETWSILMHCQIAPKKQNKYQNPHLD